MSYVGVLFEAPQLRSVLASAAERPTRTRKAGKQHSSRSSIGGGVCRHRVTSNTFAICSRARPAPAPRAEDSIPRNQVAPKASLRFTYSAIDDLRASIDRRKSACHVLAFCFRNLNFGSSWPWQQVGEWSSDDRKVVQLALLGWRHGVGGLGCSQHARGMMSSRQARCARYFRERAQLEPRTALARRPRVLHHHEAAPLALGRARPSPRHARTWALRR